jgi:hypothetical protein
MPHYNQISVVVIEGKLGCHDISKHVEAWSVLAVSSLYCNFLVWIKKAEENHCLHNILDGVVQLLGVWKKREINSGQCTLDEFLVGSWHCIRH